jgi:hypothetical protein
MHAATSNTELAFFFLFFFLSSAPNHIKMCLLPLSAAYMGAEEGLVHRCFGSLVHHLDLRGVDMGIAGARTLVRPSSDSVVLKVCVWGG